MRCESVYKALGLSVALALSSVGVVHSQVTGPGLGAQATDPGVRGGAAGAGGPLSGLTTNQRSFFNSGLSNFSETEGLADGLGPRFNLDSCAGCHAFPAIGGTSPPTNPEVAVATAFGAQNTVPSFITANGPVREARFVKKADGTPDGGVHALFVISGRNDGSANAANCHITQDNFAAQVSNHNVIFRIPTPLFGMGLVDQITDTTLRNNIAASSAQRQGFGILGQFNVSGASNTNGNDGTITRFGWKAQNKSGLLFAAEAYNVEMGISNHIFQSEREEDPNCQFARTPNSTLNFDAATPADFSDDINNFANFQRFSASPTPVTSYSGANGAVSSTSISNGRTQFTTIGCSLCHTPTLMTDPNSSVAALANKPVNAFSDFAVHHMGPGLADGISQGTAAGDQFRSAPLWGLGQRIFLLHDGRTADLVTAIQAHSSNANSTYPASEANGVITNFNQLSQASRQDLLNFLRSL